MFQNRTRFAFSLIELVIVVVILGIIALVIIPQYANKSNDRVQVDSITGPEFPVADELLVIEVTKPSVHHQLNDGIYRVVSNKQDKLALQSTSFDMYIFDLQTIKLEQAALKITFYGFNHPDYESKMQEYQDEKTKHTGGPNP